MDTNCTNSSCEEKEEKFKSIYTAYVIISILTIFMNLLIIFLFVFNRNLRKPSNFLQISFTVCNLAFGLMGIPAALICSIFTTLSSPCMFSFFFITFLSICLNLHILIISYERYFKIAMPFRFHQIGRASFELTLVLVIWFISISVTCIRLIWFPPGNKQLSDAGKRTDKIYTICVVAIFAILPWFLMIFADVSVFFIVRRQLDGIAKTSVTPTDSQQRLKKELKVLFLFSMMMLYFVISWSFYYADLIMSSLFEEDYLYRIPEWLWTVSNLLRSGTTVINPILYVLFKEDFRRVVFVGIRRLFAKYTGHSHGSSTSHGSRTSGRQSESRNVTERMTLM